MKDSPEILWMRRFADLAETISNNGFSLRLYVHNDDFYVAIDRLSYEKMSNECKNVAIKLKYELDLLKEWRQNGENMLVTMLSRE